MSQWNLAGNTGIKRITGISLASHTSCWQLAHEPCRSISGTPCARPSWQKGEWTDMASTWLQTCCCCYWNVCGWTLAPGKKNAKVEAVLIVFRAYFIRQLTVWEGWRSQYSSKLLLEIFWQVLRLWYMSQLVGMITFAS